MPNYKAHLVGGTVSFCLVLWATSFIPTLAVPFDHLIWAFALCLIGSLFPDIDVPSKIQRLFFVVSTGGVFYCLLKQQLRFFSFFAIAILFVTFLTHRTITHKPFFLIALALIPTMSICSFFPHHAFLAFGLYLYFTVGCLSHIFLDRLQTRIKRFFCKNRRF